MKSSERICTYELPFGLWLILLTDEERLVRTWLQDSKPNAEEIHSGVLKDFWISILLVYGNPHLF